MGKVLIVAGLVMVLAGLLILVGDKIPFKLGQLPGDFLWRGKNTTIYFPIASCLILSLVASFLIWLIQRK